NLGLLSNHSSLAISSSNPQSLDKQPVILPDYPLSAESFQRTEPGLDDPRPLPAYSTKSPLNSSCFYDTEDTVSFHEDTESASDLSNSQSCSALSSPQPQVELHLDIEKSALEKLSQVTNTRSVASQLLEKIAPARKRRRKEQQLNCPSCAKVFSRPCDFKKHSRTHQRTFNCTITGCTNTRGFALHKDLRRHIETVHLRSTFTCHFPSCGEVFSRSDNCLRHFDEQHS
ncbi:hypothetical protein N431DRAFT_351655, partial [Stipitochalara longipes BDJ]